MVRLLSAMIVPLTSTRTQRGLGSISTLWLGSGARRWAGAVCAMTVLLGVERSLTRRPSSANSPLRRAAAPTRTAPGEGSSGIPVPVLDAAAEIQSLAGVLQV